MSSNYPTSKDNLTTNQPYSDGTTVIQAQELNNIQDAIDKLQTKVGIDNSSDANTLDYKISNMTVTWETDISQISAINDKYVASDEGMFLVQIGNNDWEGWHHYVKLYNSSDTEILAYASSAGYGSSSHYTIPAKPGDYIKISGTRLGTLVVKFRRLNL